MEDMVKTPSIQPVSAAPIILVDDETELVHAVGAMLRSEFGESRVRATSSPEEALGWIRSEKPAVLITDVRMPGVSGLELISHVQSTWGATPTVVITAFPTEAVSVGARRGSFVYLPKPFPFRSLVETVQQLASAPAATFSGAIAVSTLADLLQLYAISGSTGMMQVNSGERRGEIWFERGQITHARADRAEGFEAFAAIIAWPNGSFSWKLRRTDRQTISMSVSELMIDAYRVYDEARRDGRTTTPPAASPSLPPLDFSFDTTPSLAAPAAPRGLHPEALIPREPSPLPPPPLPPRQSPIGPEAPAAVEEVLSGLARLDGFLGAALVDCEYDAPLGAVGSGIDVAIAALGNSQLVQAKRRTMKSLDLHDEIEDILITLGRQYHLIRLVRSRPGLFFYMALDRAQANLAMARLRLADAERDLVL
ncbi:MAG: response regulator [Myxococcaceae bacterium]|nr:MAG: response regulator [Myxococcaceae bacterium]